MLRGTVALSLLLPLAAAAAAPAAPAGFDPSVLDRSADPCTSFYDFACGGWVSRADRSAAVWGRVDEMRAAAEQQLGEVARGLVPAAGVAPDPRLAPATALFQRCLDAPRRAAAEAQALRAELAPLSDVGTPAKLGAALGRLHRRGVFAAFAFFTIPDPSAPTRTAGVIGEGETLTHTPVQPLLTEIGSPVAPSFAERAHDLEERLFAAQNNDDATRAMYQLHRRAEVSPADLQRLAPVVDWRAYFRELGYREVPRLLVAAPSVLSDMNRALAELSSDERAAFLQWHLLATLDRAGALPFGLEEVPPDGDAARVARCGSTAVFLFRDLLDARLATRLLADGGGESARRLVEELRSALEARLRAAPWSAGDMRREGLSKLSRLDVQLGAGAVPAAPSKLDGAGSFVEAYLAAAEARTAPLRAPMDEAPVRRGWGTLSAIDVSVRCELALNRVLVPAALLRPPLLGPEVPRPMVYGGLGTLLGREVAKTLDLHGRQYDARGALRDWWSDAAVDAYRATRACVARQLDEVTHDTSAPENMLDLAGVAVAWEAYRRSGAREAPAVHGLTADQQFFVGLAQPFCTFIGPGGSPPMEFAPPRWRVDAPLANLPAFAEAFQCKAGSPMVRDAADRCSFW